MSSESLKKDQPVNEPTSDSKANDRPIIRDDEIDLVQLARSIWNERRVIIYTTLVTTIIGLLVALFSPVKYTASATLLPQAEGKSNLGNLGGLASLAGINLSAMMGDATGIQPELYPRVVNSFPFLEELIHQSFNFEDETAPVSLYEKRTADSIPGLGSTIVKYTLRLPWTLKNALTGKDQPDTKTQKNSDNQLKTLSAKEMQVIEGTANAIFVKVDNKTGLVSINVELEEPLLTAQVTQKTVSLLQKYIINYKTKQVRDNLEFIEARHAEKKREFEAAQRAFFEYRDRHRNMVTERADVRYQELSDAYDLAAEVYRNLAQQREQAEIAVKKETPAFSVIEPVKVPLEKSAPRRSFILVMSVFMGGFLGLMLVFARMLWGKLREAW